MSRRPWLPLLLVGVALCPLALAPLAPIHFHQFFIHRLHAAYGLLTLEEAVDAARSAYASGLNMVRGAPVRRQPAFEKRRDVFRYVWSWVPPYAVVYPTEGFYYYAFRLGDRDVSGNLRIADLDRGVLMVAYFSPGDLHSMYLNVTGADGLQVTKHSESRYDVAFEGKTVRFKIPATGTQPPRALRMLPEEEFVAQIYDESGLKFFLLYNQRAISFYYLLNEERKIADTLESVGERLMRGTRTGFVFYRDAEFDRTLLLAVSKQHALGNDYFDGPFDQVPYRVRWREKLHAAYPHTLRGDGIDAHGVYINASPWQRMAVSPYLLADSAQEVKSRVDQCPLGADRSMFWTCLTKDPWNAP